MTAQEGSDSFPLLGRFGVTPNAEAVWRILLADPNADSSELAFQAKLNGQELVQAMDALIDGQLARPSSTRSGIAAIEPTLAIETHIARAERAMAQMTEDLASLRTHVPTLARDFARGRASAGDHPGFEVVFGTEEVRRRLYLAGERTRSEHRNLIHTQSAAGLRDARPFDNDQLDRGVRQRSIVGPIELTDPDFHAELAIGHARGELIRTLPEIPMRLIITDRDLAVLPIDPDNSGIGAMFIKAPNLIDLLIFFFERLWSDGQPVFSGSADHEAPTGRTARVLELLSTGIKDERIARALGVGVRTVRRDVADLKRSLGVSSRAEIVAEAFRKGWL